jgi:predicted deacylase
MSAHLIDMKPVTSLLRIHQYAALHSGPRLIVLRAVHGNETCGTLGIQRILDELDAGRLYAVLCGT